MVVFLSLNFRPDHRALREQPTSREAGPLPNRHSLWRLPAAMGKTEGSFVGKTTLHESRFSRCGGRVRM
jgi:hypothetical protein